MTIAMSTTEHVRNVTGMSHVVNLINGYLGKTGTTIDVSVILNLIIFSTGNTQSHYSSILSADFWSKFM